MPIKFIVTLCIVILHLLFFYVVSKSDFYLNLKNQYLGGGQEQRDNYYKTLLAFHLRQDRNIPKGSVVFFGASHVQGLAVSAVSPMAVNYGIGGDTSAGLLKRLPLYSSLPSAKLIYLSLGYNDLKYRSVDEALVSFRQILELMPSHTKVFLGAVPPVDESAGKGIISNDMINELNAGLERLSKDYPSVAFLPTDKRLVEGGTLAKEYHIGDGIHFNPVGYAIWIDSLNNTLEKTLPP